MYCFTVLSTYVNFGVSTVELKMAHDGFSQQPKHAASKTDINIVVIDHSVLPS
jgi:hypothetical protein